MSTDKKLSVVKKSKMIKPGGSFGSWLDNLEKKALTNVAIPFTRDNLPGLASNINSNVINKLERKISAKGTI